MTALVSIVMAVHNGVPYIEEAIQSILRQSWTSWELIIVDDASTDDTRAAVERYGDRRIQLLTNGQNKGQAFSLNRGIEVAKGAYVARLDADDIAHPDRLQQQVEFLESHRDIGLVGASYCSIDAKGTAVKHYTLPLEHLDLRWALLFYCPFIHSAVTWRRALEAQVGRYDDTLSYAMDYDLWLRAARHMRLANLPERLVRWRVHPQSMTSLGGPRVEEAPRLQAAEVNRFLKAGGASRALSRERCLNMHALLFGDVLSLTPPEIATALDDVLRLQTAFANEVRLAARDARRHRRQVRQRAALRLIRAARAELATGFSRKAWLCFGMSLRSLTGATLRIG
jgi:hypothetical protein